MAVRTTTNRRGHRKSKSKSKQRKTLNLHKPSGMIGPRVAKVGGEKSAIVCVDPAKHRSEWMMADYFGNLLIERQALEYRVAERPGHGSIGRFSSDPERSDQRVGYWDRGHSAC